MGFLFAWLGFFAYVQPVSESSSQGRATTMTTLTACIINPAQSESSPPLPRSAVYMFVALLASILYGNAASTMASYFPLSRRRIQILAAPLTCSLWMRIGIGIGTGIGMADDLCSHGMSFALRFFCIFIRLSSHRQQHVKN